MKNFLSSHIGKILTSLITIAGLTFGGVYTYNEGATAGCKVIVDELLPKGETGSNSGISTIINNTDTAK